MVDGRHPPKLHCVVPPLPALLSLILAAVLLSGCPAPPPDHTKTAIDDSGGTTSGLDPATVPLTGPCASDVDYGGIDLTADSEASEVAGSVADGVVPSTVLELLVAEGDCEVLRRNNPYCDPTCDPGETCDFDGTCVPYPANQDLGTLTLDGLLAPVEMEPVFPGNTYFNTSLPNPAYTVGSVLTLRMPGGVYGPAELHGVGVEPLDMTGAAWVIDGGVDFEVTWPPPTGAGVRSEVAVQISIDQHGVSPSSLRCVFVDDGAGTVPGSIIQALEDVGVTGFPTASIERRTVDHVAIGAGCMDFRVTAPRTITSIDVEGHTPCMSDADCPEELDCNEELQICE